MNWSIDWDWYEEIIREDDKKTEEPLIDLSESWSPMDDLKLIFQTPIGNADQKSTTFNKFNSIAMYKTKVSR